MEQLDDQQNASNELNIGEKSGQTRNSYKFPQVSNSKVCIFYSKYGYCKFGQNCKFLHQKKYSSNKSSFTSLNDNVSFKLPQKTEKNAIGSDDNSNRTISYKNLPKQTCRYFKVGQCEKGEECLFSHNLERHNFKTDFTFQKNIKDHMKKDKTLVSRKKSIPVCHYFRRGSCQNGDQCKFYHNPKYQKQNLGLLSNIAENNLSDNQVNGNGEICHLKNDEHDTPNASQIDIKNAENPINVISVPSVLLDNKKVSVISQEIKHTKTSYNILANNYIRIPQNSRIFNLETLSEDSLYHLRNTEINQLKKRYPRLNENGSSFTFDFEPTDPDWPYDIKSLHLQVTFPESYPLEVCDISVVSHMNYMPGGLLRHLNQSIINWLIEKHNKAIEQNQVVLLFRPFLKWFDKNLEGLFNFNLNKVTEDERPNNVANEPAPPENDSLLSTERNLENVFSEEFSISSNNASTIADSEKEVVVQKNEPTAPNSSQMQGSKVIFTGLELVEGVAALSCKKLALTLQCSRCRTSCNKILIPNKNTPMVCLKCSRNMECNFNPSILHQFSSVLGTIYLMECQVVDVNLVECAFLVDCLSCSKQVSVDGLHYGQKQKLWCKFCNQKLIIGIDGVKFQASAATTAIMSSNKTVAVKKVTKIKDPVIKEGCPLPEYGACKHYKKSFRWLRFPCCGRLYPCDLCHDEKEDDHDMKYASRMVCGFCSKEQPYSKEKPCFGCSANMTKKSGPYWEGGQGCRNSVTMSRKDVHKYAGMSKTTSKKSQPAGKKKK